MAPKRKFSSSPEDGKVEKKWYNIFKDNCPTLKAGDDASKMQQEGKIYKTTFDNKQSFCSNFKKKSFSPHLLDENQDINKGEISILELNQSL